MCEADLWDEEIAIKIAMLIENLLLTPNLDPNKFVDLVDEHQPFVKDDGKKIHWHDQVNSQYPLYWKNLLYFLARLRK